MIDEESDPTGTATQEPRNVSYGASLAGRNDLVAQSADVVEPGDDDRPAPPLNGGVERPVIVGCCGGLSF